MKHKEIDVQVTRGKQIESRHQIKAVIVSSSGEVLDSWGDIEQAVYPRSAIKAMQVLCFIELGGHEKFNFTPAEIAILCASHNAEPKHVATVENILAKIDLNESDFECGSHWPMRDEASHQLAAQGAQPNQLHNNCSGKHAGMLALARILGESYRGYINIDHPVQQHIAQVMAEMCEVDYSKADWSPDGCSAPTWAIPLTQLALAFAKFADPILLAPKRQRACRTIYQAVVDNPFMVAGTERYNTELMEIFGDRIFLKGGAEGVYIAAIPELKLAIALKCEDGASRAAESAMTALLDHVGIGQTIADTRLENYRSVDVKNCNKMKSGAITCQL